MSSTLSDSQQQWYIRRGKVVRGPFPEEKIRHYLLRGRIKTSDELSPDQKIWKLATELPQLLPSILFEKEKDALLRQQLMGRKHWEKCRAELGNESLHQPIEGATDGDQSMHASLVSPHSTASGNTKIGHLERKKPVSRVLVGFVAFSLLSAMIAMIYRYQPEPEMAEINCAAAAVPKVNWSNCQMEAALLSDVNLIGATMQNMNLMRADLSGAQLVDVNLSFSNLSAATLTGVDLRQAALVGVSLKGADLGNAVIDGADLSYADLGGAKIAGASFTGVKLDKAKWVDGRICAVGSIGDCL